MSTVTTSRLILTVGGLPLHSPNTLQHPVGAWTPVPRLFTTTILRNTGGVEHPEVSFTPSTEEWFLGQHLTSTGLLEAQVVLRLVGYRVTIPARTPRWRPSSPAAHRRTSTSPRTSEVLRCALPTIRNGHYYAPRWKPSGQAGRPQTKRSGECMIGQEGHANHVNLCYA